MFGFQRVGDLAWAAGDNRTRGFLLGGTAGRTTLNGEGLQHEDGHSHLLSSTIPNCVSYDPTYGYEVAVIVREGLRRMVAEQEDVFYYLTLMNENYPHPAMPEGAEEGILRGIHRIAGDGDGRRPAARLGHDPARGRGGGASCWRDDFGVEADVYSVTSFTELARDGMEAERWSLLHPGEDAREPYVASVLSDKPAVAATDYMRAFAEQIRPYVPGAYTVLGTDGYGRSDWRRSLREFFEVDRRYVALAALRSVAPEKAAEAIAKYEIRRDAEAPMAEVKEVTVPDIGDFDDVPVIEVLVAPGDTVAEEDPLVTLESDKATMDVPAPFAGVVQELKVTVGDKVGAGHAAAADRGRRRRQRRRAARTAAGRDVRGARRGRARSTPRSEAEAEAEHRGGAAAEAEPAPPAPAGRGRRRRPYASPAVRRLARERGIDLATVEGSGRKGRITKEDVERGPSGGAGRRAGAAPAAPGERTRARRALADQEDLRPEPGQELDDDPARHPARRGRHHRPRGVPQGGQRLPEGRQGHDGRAAREGVRDLAAGVPGGQLLARRRRST